MRTILHSRGLNAGLGLLIMVGVAACAAHPAGNIAGPSTSPAATGAASPTATQLASTPTAPPSPSPTAPAGVQNLVVTSAEKHELTVAWTTWAHLPASGFRGGGPDPGSVYYAYQPATDTYWALATFTSAIGAPLPSTVLYEKAGAGGSWNVEYDLSPLVCGEIRWYPQEVLRAWSLPSTPPPGVTC